MTLSEKIEQAWVKLKYASKDNGTFEYGVTAGQFKRVLTQFSKELIDEQLNEACEYVSSRTVATGHADTITELMRHFEEQVREKAIEEAAKIVENDSLKRTDDITIKAWEIATEIRKLAQDNV